MLVDELLEHVAERPVPDVVHESRQLHAQDVFVIDAQLRLAGSQVRGRLACKVSDSYRVLLASVVGRRVDIGGATELLYLRKTLILRRVQHAHQEGLQVDRAIQAVEDLFRLARTAVAAFRGCRCGDWLRGWLALVCVAGFAVWSLHVDVRHRHRRRRPQLQNRRLAIETCRGK